MRQHSGIFLGTVLLLLIEGVGWGATPPQHPPSNKQSIASFLSWYWARPLSAQGNAPSDFSRLEASLTPRACGTCHVSQYTNWKTSRHSQAMGPGVIGQLIDTPPHATSARQACLQCHAPLKEQAMNLTATLAKLPLKPFAEIPGKNTIKPFYQQGVVCAACHVRHNQRFGPLRRMGTITANTPGLPHGGWISAAAFKDSRFCASCHQFGTNGYALNGKLLENTYDEWRASRFARQGISCQRCHMPERKHLWRGIHDPVMVRKGLTIHTTGPTVKNGSISASLTVKSTWIGHDFPTYVTPTVTLEIYQTDRNGKVLTGTLHHYIIGRKISLDLTHEYLDTRLAPGQQIHLDYRQLRQPTATALIFRIRVEPDAFYRRFYQAMLRQGQDLSTRSKRLLEHALKDSIASAFTAFQRRRPF